MSRERLLAQGLQVADDVSLGAGLRVKAEGGSIGPGVRLGAGSHIVCRRLELEEGAEVGDGVELIATEVHLGRGARIGAGTRITAVEELRLGNFSVLGPESEVVARRVRAGDFLWAVGRLLVGGGGALSPGAVLTVGDRCTLVDHVYINLADEVTLGDEVALSYHVTILTHGAWQPILEGYDAAFAPVRIGNNVVVYTQSTVLPGVTIGDGATVGACSLVHRDVPPRTFAAGVPARVIRDASEYPPRLTPAERDARVLSVLRRYLGTVEYKGYALVRDALEAQGEAVLQGPAGRYRLVWVPSGVEDVAERLERWEEAIAREGERLIVVSLSPLPPVEGATLLDLSRMTVLGGTDEVSEDLRDHLRRSGIRIFADRPFRGLKPQALRELLEWAQEE